jgi:hypothetical protein
MDRTAAGIPAQPEGSEQDDGPSWLVSAHASARPRSNAMSCLKRESIPYGICLGPGASAFSNGFGAGATCRRAGCCLATGVAVTTGVVTTARAPTAAGSAQGPETALR